MKDVLESHIPKNIELGFMSFDVEGFDLEDLYFNDWEKFKPKIILIETSVTSDGLPIGSAIDTFLKLKNYFLIAKTFLTSLYKLNVC